MLDKEQDIINEINWLVNVEGRSESVLKKAVELIHRVYSFKSCFFFLRDEDKDHLTLCFNTIEKSTIKLFEKSSGLNLKEIKPQLIKGNRFSEIIRNEKTKHIESADEITDALTEYTRNNTIKSFAKLIVLALEITNTVRVPVMFRGQVVAILDASCDRCIDKQEIDSLERVIAHLGRLVHEIIRDITIQESENRFGAIIRSTPAPMLAVDLKLGNIVFVNAALCTLLNISKKVLINLQTSEFYVDPNMEDKLLSEIKKNGRIDNKEIKLKRRDGVAFWILFSAKVLKLNHRDTIFISFVNIDAQKKVERQLVSSYDQFNTIINASPSPVLLSDFNGVVVFANESLAAMVGVPIDKLIGTSVLDYYYEDSQRELIIKELKKEGFVKDREVMYKMPDGATGWAVITLKLIKFNEKRTIFSGFSDVTERVNYRVKLENTIREKTKELQNALNKEKELGELKSKFVSMTSHEFRTPLSVIKLTAGSLKKYWNKLDIDLIKKNLSKIEEQVTQMTSQLDEVLMIGEIGASKAKTNCELVCFNEFIGPIIEEMNLITGMKPEIKLFNSNDSFSVFIDKKMGERIFNNLFSNAIKFSSPEKKIVVNVDYEEGIVTVRDYGIGIEKMDLENIFKPFERGRNVESIKGSGLGLAIVHDSVMAMGGQITVDSVIGEGTTFSLLFKTE